MCFHSEITKQKKQKKKNTETWLSYWAIESLDNMIL